MNNQNIINEIRSKIDIVDLISEYVPLSQKGKNYFGVCPFHNDTNPSMSVSREKQIYKCFSCGASGNIFTFVSEYENISFKEALNLLANKIGYKIDTGKSYTKPDLYKKYYDIDITAEKVKQYVWAYIPHLFYTPFYVYQYATSFAASFKLYKDVNEHKEGAMERYTNLLRSGGSKYPVE